MPDQTADGSRVTCDAERRPPQPGVVVVFSAGKSLCVPLPVGESPLVLGRAAGGGGMLLPDQRLSREHATLARTKDGWVVRDSGSRNGTFVDGVEVVGTVHVASPRVIRVAETLLVPVPDLHVVAASGRRSLAEYEGAVVGWRLQQALRAVADAASAGATLVIQGESGSGKELAAQTFHRHGPHAGGPFVAVNCAAIPEGLAERLLFGAKRGTYSGAATDSLGHLQAADGGVLFLDEVGDLDLQVQAKLLRALETSEVVPLGASAGQRIDVRVCVATHRDLRAAVADGRFRADFYYRLAPPEVTMPPLRERLDEFPDHIVAVIAAASPALSPNARLIEACMLRPWPGNVRELRKEIHHAASRAIGDESDRVRVEHLSPTAGFGFARGAAASSAPPLIVTPTPPPGGTSDAGKRKYVHWGNTLTREDIQKALADAQGNVASAARSLGMHRAQLYREMARQSVQAEGDPDPQPGS